MGWLDRVLGRGAAAPDLSAFPPGTRVRFGHKGLGTVEGTRTEAGESYLVLSFDAGDGALVGAANATCLGTPLGAAEAKAIVAQLTRPFDSPPRPLPHLLAAVEPLVKAGLPPPETAELARELFAGDLDTPFVKNLRFILRRGLFDVLADALGRSSDELEAEAIAAQKNTRRS